MAIINQPFQGQLGDLLIQELDNKYASFIVFSAFAKNSGVLRIKKALQKHKDNGGSITAFIGIDLDGTSYEALLNLFSLCDNLYVIHSESFSTTYHSKIYLLEGPDKAWCAVGSNNLTSGGLWTNFESCNIEHYLLPKDSSKLENIHLVANKYMEDNYMCSIRISSLDDIDNLLNSHYITKEVSQRMENISRRSAQKARDNHKPLFGSEKVSMPELLANDKPVKNETKNLFPDHVIYPDKEEQPAFINEQFWFEMRASTGGSRNILDLSKAGRIVSGSVSGTDYEYPKDSTKMYGGVKFFGIDPDDTNRTKDITINFRGKDYYPSTIVFAPNNGSWRIQLKGAPTDGTDELSKFGNHGDFVHKILVFEKINPDYYVLSLLDEIELDRVKSLSRVWACNGLNSKSKAYGML